MKTPILTPSLKRITSLPANCHFAIDSRAGSDNSTDYGFVVWHGTRQGNVTLAKQFGYTSYDAAQIGLANWVCQF